MASPEHRPTPAALVAEIERCGGNIARARVRLGVSHMTAYRWVAHLRDGWARVQAARERHRDLWATRAQRPTGREARALAEVAKELAAPRVYRCEKCGEYWESSGFRYHFDEDGEECGPVVEREV